MALVTHLATNEVCELLGMVRGVNGRLFFALRDRHGDVICASGNEIELFNATVIAFPGRALPASVVGSSPTDAMSRNTPLPVPTHPTGRGNPINELA